MKKLKYDDFFSYIWEEDTWLSKIVSVSYLEKNDDFIRNLTFELYHIYDKGDIPLQIMVKQFEIFFSNLFRYEPDNKDIKEIQDNYLYFD